MVSSKEEMIKSISSRISSFCANNKLLSLSSRNDGAISAEDFFAGFFNVLYKKRNYNIVNANKIKINYPGIDLIDFENRIGFQVTLENSLQKIKKSFLKMPKKEENNIYSKVIFIFQLSTITRGAKEFNKSYNGYEVETMSLTDIFKAVGSISNLDQLEEVCKFVEDNVIIPNKVCAINQLDNDTFDILFQALKDGVSKKGSRNIKSHLDIYKSSSKEKKEKFKDSWEKLIGIYKQSLGMNSSEEDYKKIISYEKRINECFSEELNEVQKELILQYLRVESLFALERNNDNPILAIHDFTSKIMDDFEVRFLSKPQIVCLLTYMFFKCDVFPLIIKTNEQ